jgi:hypothetical protein
LATLHNTFVAKKMEELLFHQSKAGTMKKKSTGLKPKKRDPK